jgi:hypothetical protein
MRADSLELDHGTLTKLRVVIPREKAGTRNPGRRGAGFPLSLEMTAAEFVGALMNDGGHPFRHQCARHATPSFF